MRPAESPALHDASNPFSSSASSVAQDKFHRDHEAEQEDGLTRCTPGRKPDRKRKWTEAQTALISKRVSAATWGDSDAEYEVS